MTNRLGPLIVALILWSACAPKPKLQSPRTRPPVKVGTTATGTASWYGPGYDGKRTACGEKFDQDALTAAPRPGSRCCLHYGNGMRLLEPELAESLAQ